MKNSILIIGAILTLAPHILFAQKHQPQFSTAGFYATTESPRKVYSMNPGWRMHKGAVDSAWLNGFDDSKWQEVSLPNGIEYLPVEASGCINYQGEVWYRKHFVAPDSLSNKQLMLYFEAIMGQSEVWINGTSVAKHYGGFLPVAAEISKLIEFGKENIICVKADNSNNPLYPPGKEQEMLDFCYFGGIYRDCWLVAHNNIYITDPNLENQVSGGGLFVSFDKVSTDSATIVLKSHLRNMQLQKTELILEYELQDKEGKMVAFINEKVIMPQDTALHVNSYVSIADPHLWSPESPYLYNLYVRVRAKDGTILDGYRRRVGIRSIEFKGQNGFYLNGKPYEGKLIGANRHQDYAVVGNSLSNSTHWRDAKKLRDAGLKVIRNAHYPQDPAFMDSCDELGLFVIVNTPGWQFWNQDPIFAERVYSDIRSMVRRDRNHPSVWIWEPILNETWYPADFALRAKQTVEEEYPYPYCYTGCDSEAHGSKHYPVLFAHPKSGDSLHSAKHIDPTKTYFTREWGDNVDDWNSHNSPSRVRSNWGETPQLIQATHYAKPSYMYSSYDALYRSPVGHVGGTLWHSFDHQRGYHPDPFYGGIMDSYRQPKYSYYMFKSQRSPVSTDLIAETGPIIYIAHQMSPFSPKDVTVYSNCDSVVLRVCKDGKEYTFKRDKQEEGMPYPIITFKDAYDFMATKEYSRVRRAEDVWMIAEGYIDGNLSATHTVKPALRPAKLLLWADSEGLELRADGSDFVTVVAAIADEKGNIKRLNNYAVRFKVTGEGKMLGSEIETLNPATFSWGLAPIIIQSTTVPGTITIEAEVFIDGAQMPLPTTLTLTSVEAANTLLFNTAPATEAAKDASGQPQTKTTTNQKPKQIKISDPAIPKEALKIKLKEVERQQAEFGENR